MRTACQEEYKANKTYRQFYRQLALPAVTISNSEKAGVRHFSTRLGSVPSYDDGEGLKLELPLAQSAFSPLRSAAWLKIAVSIAPAAAMRSSLTLWV